MARLHVEDLAAIVGPRTRLVACTMASNATGSVSTSAASRGARMRPARRSSSTRCTTRRTASIDVQAFDCDYLVCSGYKIFAPHMGFAWCRREAINRLPTFREDFIPDVTPDKLEAGTYVYENVAGMDAAVDYLEGLDPHPGAGGTRVARDAARDAGHRRVRARALRVVARRDSRGSGRHGPRRHGARPSRRARADRVASRSTAWRRRRSPTRWPCATSASAAATCIHRA